MEESEIVVVSQFLMASNDRIQELQGKLDSSHAIVMRVYRECGPEEDMYTRSDDPSQSLHPFVMCKCGAGNDPGEKINHYEDCLWKSAETLLRKEGLI
jgi:hypothetical protein